MDRDARPADAAHAMTTVLRQQQRVGRFGRELPGDEVLMDDSRTRMETDDAGEHFNTADYVIDVDAVAAAIVDRLIAGRTIAAAPPKQR
jgi:hypothetical protein